MKRVWITATGGPDKLQQTLEKSVTLSCEQATAIPVNRSRWDCACPGSNPIALMNQNRSVFGFNLGHLWHEAPRPQAWMGAVLDGVAAGWARPHVDKTFPLGQAAEAQAYIEGRKNTGKVVLVA